MMLPKLKDDPSLNQAILKSGNASTLARLLGVSRAAVSQWKRVPVNRITAVERVTGIPRHLLRPDLSPVVLASLDEASK